MKPLLSIVFLFSLFFIVRSQNIQLGSTLLASNLNQSWSSPNNTFPVGFIADGSAYFAVITYNGILVWKADSDSGIADSFASFQFLSNGNLRLVNFFGTVVWSSNTASRGVSSATLDDSDPSSSAPVIMAYGGDYAEGTDILWFLKLDSDRNLRIYSSPKSNGSSATKRWVAVSDQCQVLCIVGFGYL